MSKPISDLREDVRRNFFAQKGAEGMTDEQTRESLNRVARFWGMMGFDLASWMADDALDTEKPRLRTEAPLHDG